MENNIIEDNILTIDSTDSRMKIISIEGNEKQDTREGYNLVNPLAKKNVGNNGVTVDFKEDGSIVFNGTSNGLGAWLISDDINYEPGEKYTMIVDIIKGTVTNSKFGWGILIYPYVSENAIKILDTSSGRITKSFTFPSDTEISQKNIYLWFGETEEGATFDDFTIKIMIVKGENVVDKEFELYGSMPSFDYPSEIKTVGDNINIFNDEAYKGFVVTQQNYNALEKIDLKLKNNKYYVAKIYFEDGTFVAVNNSNFMLYAYKADGTQSVNIPNQIAKSYANATELVKAKIVANSTGLNTYANKVIAGIKIEEVADADGQPSPYSNYGEGCIELKVVNKTILDTNKINSTLSGVKFESDLDGSLNISGTPTKKFISIKSKIKLDYPIKAGTKISFLFGKSVDLQKDSELTPFLWASDENDNSAGNINTSSDDFSIIASRDVTNITWGIEGFDTSINYNTKLYLMLVTGDITQNKYIQREEQSYVIPVQQKLLTGDGFSKKDGTRKEVHTWQEVIFNGEENWLMNYGTSLFNLASNNIYNQSSTEHKALCNMSKFDNRQAIMTDLQDKHFAMQTAYNSIFFKDTDCKTADEFKVKLKELYEAGTPLKVVYKINAPVELDCTKEQIEVLDKSMYLYNGISNIYTEDEIAPKIEVEIKKIVEDYDAYISNEGYFIIPEYDIKYLINLNESNIPSMPEATETSIKVAGRDGDVPLNTTYEPISFDLVCYTEDNLNVLEKSENEAKVNLFLNSIKNKTKKFAIERDMKFYDIKYNGSLTRTNYPAHLKFSIPFKSSDSYAKDLKDKMIVGNSSEESNTINNVGALFTIKGPATMPIISLNDYSMEYSTSILEGARIEIDSNKSTITHINSDGVKTNVMKHYNHQFPKIEKGNNTLKILSGVNNSSQVNVKWRDLKL